MKIRFKIAWRNYRVGDVIDPAAMLAGDLIKRGFAEPVKAELEISRKPEVETAVRTVKKTKRGGL